MFENLDKREMLDILSELHDIVVFKNLDNIIIDSEDEETNYLAEETINDLKILISVKKELVSLYKEDKDLTEEEVDRLANKIFEASLEFFTFTGYTDNDGFMSELYSCNDLQGNPIAYKFHEENFVAIFRSIESMEEETDTSFFNDV